MARAKRNRQQRQADLERMLTWRQQGWSERRIAAALGLSQSTVHRDLEELDRRWVESIPDKVTILKRGQVAAVNHALAEAWDAFQESRKTAMRVVEVQKRVPVPEQPAEALSDGVTTVFTDEFVTVERRIETVNGPGDPKFLTVIAKLLEDRAKLLKLYDAPAFEFDAKKYIYNEAKELGVDPEELYQSVLERVEKLNNERFYGE